MMDEDTALELDVLSRKVDRLADVLRALYENSDLDLEDTATIEDIFEELELER